MNDISGLSLKYLLKVVALRRRLVIGVAAGIFTMLAAYVVSLKAAYTATAVVLLAPLDETLTSQGVDRGAQTDPFFIRSETVIISSDQLSRSVVRALKLSNVPEFQPEKGWRDWFGRKQQDSISSGLTAEERLEDYVVRYYRDHLSVFNDGRSKTVEIGFTASDPRTAAKIANAHAQAYLQQQSTRRGNAQQTAIDWLAKEVDGRASELRDAETAVQAYQLGHGIVSTQGATVAEQKLVQLNSQLGEARRQLSTQSALLSEVRRIRNSGDASSAVGMVGDEALKSLLQNRIDKEAAVAALEKRLASEHPTLVKERLELASINRVLDAQLERLEQEASSNASWWQRQVDDLDQAATGATASKVGQDRVAVALPALIAQAQVRRTVFETVLGRYQTLLAERGFAAPAATLVSSAQPSTTPSYPRTSLLLAMAAVFSAMAGLGAALIAQLRLGTSMGVTAIADTLGIRPLVSIPRFGNPPGAGNRTRISDDPRLFIESIRFLRNAVLEQQAAGQTVACLVTSVLPQQGKSLVAMSLARAVARSRRRTLFMEGDLRRPTGSTLAGRTPPAQGLAAVLRGEVRVCDAVLRDDTPGLDMLLAEEYASEALDQFTHGILRDLLSELRTSYDVIVIDSPPVGIVSDALSLTTLVDETVLVVKDGDASIAELKRGIRLLRDQGARVTGLVMTSVDPRIMSPLDRKVVDRYVVGIPPATGRATG